MADRVMLRRRPSSEILSGESADVYFARAEEILRREGLDPMVTMEVFARQEAVLCGIDEAKILIAHALEKADPDEVSVEGLDDGDTIASKEIVLRIRARYREFGLYETAILGMMAQALGDRLYGIRLDTPSERGRVTADLVTEIRARLDQAGFGHVTIVVSGGLNPDRIRYFKEQEAPVDSFAVGSYISGATPIDFTGDIKEIDGRPIAKRGRIPGVTESPRLTRVDLAAWRSAV